MRLLICLAAAACLAGCSEIEDDSVLQNDSLAVIPIAPGTKPPLEQPDTERAPVQTPQDSTAMPQ